MWEAGQPTLALESRNSWSHLKNPNKDPGFLNRGLVLWRFMEPMTIGLCKPTAVQKERLRQRPTQFLPRLRATCPKP